MSTIADTTLWAVTLGAFALLIAVDLILTRRPHAVGMREAAAWSAFYVALPLAFGAWVWLAHGQQPGVEFLTGYVVEKSLSADNLFVFLLLLSAFAVPEHLRQRVLLYGILGALALRAVFIALGAAALEAFSFTFLVFGIILAATAVKVFRDARSGHGGPVDVDTMRSVRLIRRVVPVAEDYDGARLVTRVDGRRAVTPLAVAVVAVLATDIVFAVDSVPAVYGITSDPYLVLATNAFALLGLRALYFLLAGALSRLVHLGYGLAIILGVIGVKLVLHWAHGIWPAVPEIPTLLGLAVIVGVLVVVTITSLRASRRSGGENARPLAPGGGGREDQHIHRSTASR
ncbi:MAG TPA: TerC/Alx family metal homeostasis membrane protein [Kineosporiaceae bacterium]|nr:TerC/Alx family metal homeostasis membrane protein [Kineosporiaceae bacterium]